MVSPTNPNHRKHTERLCQASSEPLSIGVEIAYLHRCAKSHSVVSGIQCVNFLKQGNKLNTGVSKVFKFFESKNLTLFSRGGLEETKASQK